jgi:hypothetical protein
LTRIRDGGPKRRALADLIGARLARLTASQKVYWKYSHRRRRHMPTKEVYAREKSIRGETGAVTIEPSVRVQPYLGSSTAPVVAPAPQ